MGGDKMEVIKEIKGISYIISDDGKIYLTSNVGSGYNLRQIKSNDYRKHSIREILM